MSAPSIVRQAFWLALAAALAWPAGAADLSQGRPSQKDVEITEVARTSTQSLHRVRVYTRETLHRHDSHDSTVFLRSGHGTLYLNGQAHPMDAGAVIMIPRGAPHYFANENAGSFSEALAVFSPPFDGKDRILVGEPTGTANP